MAQTLTDIRALLQSRGIFPKHSYGQNFLHDANQMARVVRGGDLKPGDVVLEVGPGTGGLTDHLLDAGATVVAVELDRRLEPILAERFAAHTGRFRLIVGDVLAGKHALNPAVTDALRDTAAGTGGRFKLVANLPYQAACPLLVNLAHQAEPCRLQRASVMVQREVADRLTASPGTRDYGPITIILQAVFDVSKVGHVPATCFWPTPKVESAVVKLVRRPEPLCADLDALTRLVRRLFTQRRKQIGNILGRSVVLPEGIDPASRPQRLTPGQLAELAAALD